MTAFERFFDDVLEEVAASEGETSVRDAASRVAREGREEQRHTMLAEAEARAEARAAERAAGRAVCHPSDYMAFISMTTDNYVTIHSMREGAGGGVVGEWERFLADLAEMEFVETLRDCSAFTERLVAGEVPALEGDDRWTQLSNALVHRSEDWQGMRDEVIPTLRRWVIRIY